MFYWKKKKSIKRLGIILFQGGHGHSHGGLANHHETYEPVQNDESSDEESQIGSSHGHSHEDGHSHSHGDDHSHSHGDDHNHSHGDNHSHSHGKFQKKPTSRGSHGHAHEDNINVRSGKNFLLLTLWIFIWFK